MKMSAMAHRLFWLASLICLLVAVPARAQDMNATARSAARTLGYAGVEAFQRGDYATASDKLEKAYSTFQMPSLGLWSARAREKLGRLVEAAERYREVAALKPTAGEEDVQRKAMQDATSELKALEPRIPSVVVTVEGAPPSGVTVTLDTAPMPPSLVGEAVPINPGSHRLIAQGGGRTAEQSVVVRESERSQVVLRLDAGGAAVGVPGAPASAPPAPAVVGAGTVANTSGGAARPGSLQRTAGWVAVGVGGALLVTGAVTGVMAMGKRSSLDGPDCHLDDNVCLKTKQDDVDSYNGLRHTSTLGFVAGGVLAGAGGVLLFTAPTSEQRVSVWVTPRSVALRGEF
jgi:hypothetical protein